MRVVSAIILIGISALSHTSSASAAPDIYTPYEAKAMERESVFAFIEKPQVKLVAKDRHEISFAVKGNCDVTVSLVDDKGNVVRHLASGVLGKNAPAPFQRNSLSQKVYWDGKDDLGGYVREPEKLKVKVELGLKPVFDKLLGWTPKSLVGTYRGIAADKDGVYVLSGDDHVQVRKYDRDGNYMKTVFPPAADVPLDRFRGLEKIEYEKGRFALVSGEIKGLPSMGRFTSTIFGYGVYFPAGAVRPHQMLLSDGLLTYATVADRKSMVWLYRVNVEDGGSPKDSTYAWRQISRGMGVRSSEFVMSFPKLALSPDKKWLYLSGLQGSGRGGSPAVFRLDATTSDPLGKKTFVGEEDKLGGDDYHFAGPEGIAVDQKGRVYVCDTRNNRIQIYSEDAKFLKSIKLDRAYLVEIHPTTGAIYVLHGWRERGKSVARLTKLESFDKPKPVAEYDVSTLSFDKRGNSYSGWEPVMRVDHFSSPTRVWVTSDNKRLLILEEQGKKFKVVRDFKKEANEIAGTQGFDHQILLPMGFTRVSADPNREQLYFRNVHVFDLNTGEYLWRIDGWPSTDDVDFDKRGYVHVHFNPGFGFPGVGRVAPDQIKKKEGRTREYHEVPYDYGVARNGWQGVLDVRDQPGGHYFQFGMDVTMQGEVAIESCIYYVPRMEDSVQGDFVNQRAGSVGGHSYQDFLQRIKKLQQQGAAIYTIRRQPGIVLSGNTLWVFERTGEYRSPDLCKGLLYTNGVGVDEDGAVYTVLRGTRMVGGKPFLYGKTTIIGSGKEGIDPFNGTLIKVPKTGARVLRASAPTKMDPWPTRPHDVVLGGSKGWLEDVEWTYAGGSPIVSHSCKCPNMRICTDWYKRTWVPEAYRNSVGIVDTAGNLIMHLGTYGNADSGRDGKDVTFGHLMDVTATDNYACVPDMSNERIVVTKITYHATETIPIK